MSNAVVCQSRLGVSLFRFISLLEIRHLRPRPLSGAARTGGLHSAQTHYVRLRESQRFRQNQLSAWELCGGDSSNGRGQGT